MRFGDVIAKKRDGRALNSAEIEAAVAGITSGTMADAQVGAFAMAIFLKGMTGDERVALTRAMQHSGTTLSWDLPGPVVDKHSTGGVGDNVSLILAPALAACGAYVPMISGRGLGHTGGTLDKLDAIPGYSTAPDLDELKAVLTQVGCAIIGQTADIAPADRRLYAVRDVTGTVESIDLICASILSKKLAAGLDALVLDVKTGSGAFMADLGDARKLAKTLVGVAKGAGCPTTALITDMSEPLASAAGNALEVKNALDLLTGSQIDGRLWDVTVALGGAVLAGVGTTDGAERVAQALASGAAAERFGAMVAALGGPADILENDAAYLPQASVIVDVTANTEGFVTAIDTRAIGNAVVALGGGRSVPTDVVDPAVGLDTILGLGALTEPDTPLARVHAQNPEAARAAADAVRSAFTIADSPTGENLVIAEVIT